MPDGRGLQSDVRRGRRSLVPTSSAVEAASYSTGQGGSRLKWLPQRARIGQGESAVTAVQYTIPSKSRRPLRTAQNQFPTPSANALNDPFGDKKKMPSPAPAEKLGETHCRRCRPSRRRAADYQA